MKLTSKQYLEETRKLRDRLEGGFLELAERLAKIRNEEIWRGVHDSFEEFLETIKTSPGTASKLITIYEKLVEGYKFPRERLVQLGWSGLYQIAQFSKTKAEAKELIEIGAGSRRADLQDEIAERKFGCQSHELGDDRITLARCKICGRMCRVE